MENLKLIGVEIRVGVNGAGLDIKREVKLIPLDITWPAVLSSYFSTATAEVTFHTSHGDVTMQVRLPQVPYDSGRQISRDDVQAAMTRFVESLTEPRV